MVVQALAWFVILFVLGWIFMRPGGWLSDEKKSPKRGRRKG